MSLEPFDLHFELFIMVQEDFDVLQVLLIALRFANVSISLVNHGSMLHNFQKNEKSEAEIKKV